MTSEGVVICAYGPSGLGKTVDMGYSFPRALFLAAPGALNSVKSVCGYEPDQIEARTISEAIDLLQRAKKKGYSALVIDDFSFMAEQTFSEFEKKFSGFRLWGALRDVALDLRDEARYSGMIVAFNAWEQPPKEGVGMKAVRGGPKLSGTLPESLPALCDVVLRAVHEPHRKLWPAAYRCYLDPSWAMKDRFNIANTCDPAPMNLSEILRAAGFSIQRHAMANGQEEQVQALSESLSGVDSEDIPMANEVYTSLIAKGVPKNFARWTVRDALDRAVIRRALDRTNSTLITTSPVLG